MQILDILGGLLVNFLIFTFFLSDLRNAKGFKMFYIIIIIFSVVNIGLEIKYLYKLIFN